MLDFLIDNAWGLLIGFVIVAVLLTIRAHWSYVKKRADRGGDFEKIAKRHWRAPLDRIH